MSFFRSSTFSPSRRTLNRVVPFWTTSKYFSTKNSKHVLVSAGLGTGTPRLALDFLEKHGYTLDVMERKLDKNERRSDMLARLKSNNYDALYVSLNDPMDEEVISATQPSCKCLSTMSVGFNHIDVEACNAHKITIGYTPGILTDTTADLVVTLLMATARNLIPANKAVYNGEWGLWTPLWMCGKDVFESTVGIVGMGRIGYAVAKRLSGFGCRILYSDTSSQEHPNPDKLDMTKMTMEQVLKQSDFVTPLCALNKETTHLFSDAQFDMMREDAIFINVSRGEVVDQDALARALKKRSILAAGLDVTTPEPLPLDHELLTTPNLTLLPHIASASVATRNKMAMMASENILAVLEGKMSPNVNLLNADKV